MTQKQITPHGSLIEAARGSRSVRSCAAQAGISEARWRQVVKGFQRQGGMDIPVNTTPRTLSAMARVVGADVPTVLAAAGMDPDDAVHIPPPNPAREATDVQLISVIAERLGVSLEELTEHGSAPITQAGDAGTEERNTPTGVVARTPGHKSAKSDNGSVKKRRARQG